MALLPFKKLTMLNLTGKIRTIHLEQQHLNNNFDKCKNIELRLENFEMNNSKWGRKLMDGYIMQTCSYHCKITLLEENKGWGIPALLLSYKYSF